MRTGRHFLQIPGPTNVPDRVLRAVAAPTIDHRGPEFAALTVELLESVKPVFGTSGPVIIYPASGTGAWEAALVNTLSPGDRVLCYETGHFAALWERLATRIGLQVEVIAGDWRSGVDADAIEERLRADPDHQIRAVMVVHNETSTGVTSSMARVREAIDAANHPALFMVDSVSAIGCIEFRHDEWGVDVTIAGSQKGLMMPPGLGFNAISEKALAAWHSANLPRSYWDWGPILSANKSGFFPYTPATGLLYALREALAILDEEGLPAVFARHERHAHATREAVRGWGLELLCQNDAEHSSVLTAVRTPDGYDADKIREIILERYDMSLGMGLGKLSGKVFRIGHMGHFNDLQLAGTLCGVEMGLRLAGVPIQSGGMSAAMDCLLSE